jgi:hypothetical protein
MIAAGPGDSPGSPGPGEPGAAAHDSCGRLKPRGPRSIHPEVTPVPGHSRRAVGAAWVLTLLTTLSSVAFAVAAIAGWVLGMWPATPVTLGVAAAVVVGGPLVAALLTRGVRSSVTPRPRVIAQPPAPPVRPAPRLLAAEPAPLPPLQPRTPEQVLGRELLDWRDRPLAGRH